MWFDSDGDLLPGLLPGLYRGISFFCPDTSTKAGRRVAETLFPGVEWAAYDDMGYLPDTVDISALVISDDYIAIAQQIRSAFKTPGPATLIHPWLGPMTVILQDPGEISFAAAELRVVRFTATFKVQAEGAGFGFGASTLTGLVLGIADVVTTASALVSAVDDTVISTVKAKASTRSGRIVIAAADDVAAPAGSLRFVPRLKASLPARVDSPSAYDAMMIDIAGRISARDRVPAVAPAASAVIEAKPTPSALVTVGLDLATALVAAISDAPSSADAALIASGAAHLVASLATQALDVDYDSRNAAIAYRTSASTAIGDLMDAMTAISSDLMVAEAGAMRRALRALQTAIIKDVNETIGRLPRVVTFSPGQPIDAFLLATHVAGNQPDKIEAVYRDIVARNRPRHPAQIDSDAIEVKL